MDYTAKERSLDPGCSVNVIAQRAAEFYIQNEDIRNAVICAEHFTETRDKVSLFKRAGLKDEVCEFLKADKNYDEMYRLFKGWGWFQRGAEVAEKLENRKAHCDFLLLVVKEKLQSEQEYTKESKHKDAEILEKAGKQLPYGDIKLLMQLMCAILRNDSGACFNICKKFIEPHINNHFGAIEALNAAFTIKKPNFELEIASVLDKVSLVMDITQHAQYIVDKIFTPGMLTTQLIKCRKIYQFELSEDTYFSPPCQFYWTPNLTILCKSQDGDGMIQFDKLILYEEIKRHFNDIINDWLEIEPERIIYEAMNSEELNSTFDINTYLNFAEICSKCTSRQVYLRCCIKLVEIACFHISKRKRKCSVSGKDWELLRNYGSKRICKMFSPQWSYYLCYSRKEVEMVSESRSVCECMRLELKPRDEVKQDINSFLFNWRICKLTNTSLAQELETCLREEETRWNEIRLKEKENQRKEDQTEGIETKQESITDEVKNDDQQKNAPKKQIKNEELQKNQEKTKMHNETPGVLLVDKNSEHHHGFFTWLKCCKLLESGNFFGFAEGVIKRLLFLVVKRKSIKPKIKVLDLISMLEIICTGLFGLLQVTDVMENLTVSLPENYEHAVKFFDGLNSTEFVLLNAVANSATTVKHSRKDFDLSLHLLQQTFYLLLGGIEPSFNVLLYAASRHSTVINNGFERCLGLCLCLLGNLSAIISYKDSCYAYTTLYSALNAILKFSHDIPDQHSLTSCFPDLHEIVTQFNTMIDFNDSFLILATIQQHYNHSLTSLKFHRKDKRFTFRHVDPKEFHKPPKNIRNTVHSHPTCSTRNLHLNTNSSMLKMHTANSKIARN